jgi:hypothetical protein
MAAESPSSLSVATIGDWAEGSHRSSRGPAGSRRTSCTMSAPEPRSELRIAVPSIPDAPLRRNLCPAKRVGLMHQASMPPAHIRDLHYIERLIVVWYHANRF